MFHRRSAIIDIDDDSKTVYFDTYKLRKITGTHIGPVLEVINSQFKS